MRAACLSRGLYTTLIMQPPSKSSQAAPESSWVVRTVRMTTSSYSVWDVSVRSLGNGRFEVHDLRRVFGVMS
jgi:hypothetical protein